MFHNLLLNNLYYQGEGVHFSATHLFGFLGLGGIHKLSQTIWTGLREGVLKSAHLSIYFYNPY